MSVPEARVESDGRVLRIPSVELRHAGNYSCLARNHFGVDEITYSLVVKCKCGAARPRKKLHKWREAIDVMAGHCTGTLRWESLSSLHVWKEESGLVHSPHTWFVQWMARLVSFFHTAQCYGTF